MVTGHEFSVTINKKEPLGINNTMGWNGMIVRKNASLFGYL